MRGRSCSHRMADESAPGRPGSEIARCTAMPIDQGLQNASMGATENMDLKPGSRWSSQVCDTEVVIVRAPASAVSLECGGHPMVAQGGDRASGLALDPAFAGGALIGKRFADADSGLELLVTKAGAGSLAIDGTVLPLKEAKPLPSSD
jgi:hypothetical protein